MRREQQIVVIASSAPSLGGGAPVVSSFSLPAANFDTRSRAARSGQYGSSYAMAYVANDTDYWWWTHNGVGPDPGDWIAALAGKTGHVTDIAAGNRTAAQVGAATRAAHSLGGSGATVAFPGTCSAGTVPIASAGAAGLWGNRNESATARGNPITIPLGQHFTSPSASSFVASIRVNLDGDGTEPVSVAVYTGGSAADPNGGVLAISYTVTPNGPAWYTYVPTAAEAFALASSTSTRIIVNASTSNATSYPGFNQGDGSGLDSDLTDMNLEIYDATVAGGGFDNSQPWPSTLSGRSYTNPFGLRMLVAIEYRQAPFCSDASRRGFVGVHTDQIFGGQQSALTFPDAAGANVYVGVTMPTLIGMEQDRHEVAAGGTHDSGAQFRLPCYSGGSIGDASGATLATDVGQTSGTATQAWLGVDVVGSVPIASGATLQLDTRGNGGITIRYATSGSPEIASPDWSPADLASNNEFETNSGSTNSTDDAVAAEATVDGTGGTNPGNYPGRRVRWRTPGIVAA